MVNLRSLHCFLDGPKYFCLGRRVTLDLNQTLQFHALVNMTRLVVRAEALESVPRYTAGKAENIGPKRQPLLRYSSLSKATDNNLPTGKNPGASPNRNTIVFYLLWGRNGRRKACFGWSRGLGRDSGYG